MSTDADASIEWNQVSATTRTLKLMVRDPALFNPFMIGGNMSRDATLADLKAAACSLGYKLVKMK